MWLNGRTSWMTWWAVVLLAVAPACSRPTRPETADVDLGQSLLPRSPVARVAPAPSRGQAAARGEAAEPAAEPKPPAAAAERPQAEPDARPPTQSASGRTASEGTASEGEASKPGAAGVSGDSTSDRAGPEAAFPGRKPRRLTPSPAAAAQAAGRSLAIARAALQRGDTNAAAEEAYRAYDLASEHGDHRACARLAADANRLILAIGGRHTPTSAPTLFQ